MKNYLAAVGLVLCLILSACDISKPAAETAQPSSPLGEAAGIQEDALLLTIDGREIPAWRYLYWLAYTCARVQERYQAANLPLDWDTPVSGGTLADYGKDQALADTALYAAVENRAEKYGCTAEESAEDTTDSVLPDMGLSGEQMEELERVSLLYAELYELYGTEGSELAPSPEELRKYGEEQGAVTLNRILIPIGDDREAAQKKAAEVFSQINSAADQAAVFSTLAAEGGDPTGVRTVLPGDGQLAEELVEAAQALEAGQCSGILETEEGFSVLQRLPLEEDALREGYFDHLLQRAAEESAVTTTPEYTELDAAAFAKKFLNGQQDGAQAES